MSDLLFGRLPCTGPVNGHFGEWYPGPPPYQHRGVDFEVGDGTPVYAPAGGRSVPFANDGSFGAHSVCLEHEGTGLFSLYAHLQSRVVALGAVVKEGDLLGYSGHEGKGTGPHLHWQVCVNTQFPVNINYSRDPMDYLVTEDDMKAIEDLQRRVDALEAIVIENGFDAICRPGTEDLFPPGTPVVPEGKDGPLLRLTGDKASEYARRRGFSLGLAVQRLQQR